MPLVKGGRIVEDRFVRVLDDAPVPEGVPVLLPAARLIADAHDLVERQAPTGVIWPNDRKIAELVVTSLSVSGKTNLAFASDPDCLVPAERAISR